MIGVFKTTKSLIISIIFAFFVVTFVCDNDLALVILEIKSVICLLEPLADDLVDLIESYSFCRASVNYPSINLCL